MNQTTQVNETLKHGDHWWRGGVLYQIYPRSYADSNGDGIGDLRGITAKLPYIQQLGVDAIWISPFCKSPQKDFGYDVSDYKDVDPMFGSLDDFKTLLKCAHDLGLKVMMDQVLSHTSDAHPWFTESRQNTSNPRADWYVWADPKTDGNPPNNWLSIFGGSAWQWDTRREQYYMHNFLTSQPDLNFHNAQVQEAVLDVVKFWLDLGVDGFRLDTANFYVHDAQLRDNPPRGRPDGTDGAVTSVNPYGWQWHTYDKSQPENLAFIERLRALTNQYDFRSMVGEIGDDDGLACMAEYTAGNNRLHMAYSFNLLGARHDAPFLYELLKRFEDGFSQSWPCWSLSNHDITRFATRWGGSTPSPQLLNTAAAFLLTLRGTPCLYQGDELGLPEADIAFEELQDPYGITLWPAYKGRDGCRTPFPWQANAPHLGFSDTAQIGTPAKPWLPASPSHQALAVDVQQNQTNSSLRFYQAFLQWRKTQTALQTGTMKLCEPHPQVLAYVRQNEGQTLLCAFNFSDQAVDWQLPKAFGTATLNDSPINACLSNLGTSLQSGSVQSITLPAWGGMTADLA